MKLQQIKNRKFTIIILIVIALAVPLTILLASKQQDLRSHASGGDVSFELSPQTITKNVGDNFSVDVYINSINSGGISLSGLDTNLVISRNLVDFVSFGAASTFDHVINNRYSASSGILRITAVNVTNVSPVTQKIKIGTLTLHARAIGTATVTVKPFQNKAQVVKKGGTAPLVVGGNKNGSYTIIAGSSLTPTPTPPPTIPTGTITVSPNPCTIVSGTNACANVTLSWNAINTSHVTLKLLNSDWTQDVGLSGSTSMNGWIREAGATFVLYAANGQELSRVSVHGVKTSTPSPTPAPSIQTVNIVTGADSYVESSQPTTNFGASASLFTDTGPIQISYIRFDLKPYAGKTIVKATLRLKVNDPSLFPQTLMLVAKNVNWQEANINYNNKPSFDSTIENFSVNLNNMPTKYVNLDVTNAANLRKGTAITFGITSGGNDKAEFVSGQGFGTDRPTLVLQYQ